MTWYAPPRRITKEAASWSASLNEAEAYSPEYVAAMTRWLSALTGLSQAQVEAALTAGDVGMITAQLWDAAAQNESIEDLDARLQAEVQATIAKMVEAAGVSQWASLGFKATFDLDNPYSAAWIPEGAASLVTEVSASTKRAIAEVIERGFAEGNPPREMAREIRTMIGLTSQGRASLASYAADLAKDPKRKPAQTARMVEKRHAKLLNDRALLIARTETIDAHAEGALGSWRDARDKGLLPPGVAKIWIAAAGSDRTCPICMALHDTIVGIDAEHSAVYQLTSVSPFKTITARAPTAHPACRCSLALRYL